MAETFVGRLMTLTRSQWVSFPSSFICNYIMCEIRQGGGGPHYLKIFKKSLLNFMILYIIFDPIEVRERLLACMAMAAAQKRLHRNTMHSNRFWMSILELFGDWLNINRWNISTYKVQNFCKYENFMRIVKAQVHANQNAFNLLWHEKGWGSSTGGTSNY